MNVNRIISGFSQLKVLVAGDLMIDRYLLGKVSRVSPEAPVPIVEWEAEENRLGGAANVALNVDALGAKAYLCGVVGQDHGSQCFFELMEHHQLDTSLVCQIKDRPTTVKTRVIAHDQHLLRLDREVKSDISVEEAGVVIQKVASLLATNKIDIVIIQDYNKGVLTKAVIKELLKLAKDNSIPVAVDPKFNNFWDYQQVQLFKPNLKEVRDILPFSVDITSESLAIAARFINEQLNTELLMITLSENGAFMSANGLSKIYPTSRRQVADVCGAGDAVIAVASLALAMGLNETQIALLANLAGGQVVEKVGVVPINLDQLKGEMIKQGLMINQ